MRPPAYLRVMAEERCKRLNLAYEMFSARDMHAAVPRTAIVAEEPASEQRTPASTTVAEAVQAIVEMDSFPDTELGDCIWVRSPPRAGPSRLAVFHARPAPLSAAGSTSSPIGAAKSTT